MKLSKNGTDSVRTNLRFNVTGSTVVRAIFALFIVGAGLVVVGVYSDLVRARPEENMGSVVPPRNVTHRRHLQKDIENLQNESSGFSLQHNPTLPRDVPDVGGVDTSFGASVTSGLAQVVGLATQPDGKFIVGGSFSTVNGVTRSRIERFNPDGTRDLGFNPGGIGPNGVVYVILILPDNKIMIGGFFTTYNGMNSQKIARLNADGTLDPTFTAQGTSLNGGAQDMIIQPDGKILVCSNFTAFNGVARNAVARLNADGTLDAAFNPNVMNGTAGGFVEELMLQPNGKIVIGGVFTTVGGVARNSLARLNSDGSLDTSFVVGTGVQLGGGAGGVYGAELQPDGKILIGGDFETYNGAVLDGNIARVNSDGSLDASFNPTIPGGNGGGVEFFAIQPDGKIVIVGFSGLAGGSIGTGVIRLNPDGTTDPSFSPAMVDNYGYVVTLQADGKILVGGFFTEVNGTPRGNVVRLNPDGTPDSFNAVLEYDALVYAVVQQPDGKFLIGGQFGVVDGVPRRDIARLNPDGTLDTTFDAGTGPDNPGTPFVYSIAVQADGKILVGGFFTSFNGGLRNDMVRLNPNGTVDGSFSYEDSVSTVRDIKVRQDTKLVVAGRFINAAQQVNSGIVKLNSDGSYDLTAVGTGANATVTRIVPQPDGRAIIVGAFTAYDGTPRNRIARVNEDGSLDPTFDPGTGANGAPFDVALVPNGQMYVGGAFTTFNSATANRIVRLNSTGSVDTGFNAGVGFNNNVYALTIELDNSILAGGVFSSFSGTAVNQIAHLNSNGSLDLSFSSQLNNGLTNDVERFFRQTDDKLIVAGRYSGIGGVLKNSIARLNADSTGTCDPIPISYGQSIGGSLNSGSCIINGPTDLYSFSGIVGQQIVVSLGSVGANGIQTASLELANVGGKFVVASNSGTTDARIPAGSGFFTLPTTDTYYIRASSAGGFGDYLLSLTQQPVAACSYTVSPGATNVSPSGGTFFFDVLTGVGCPTVTAMTGANSGHIHIVSNSGGRVTFSVDAHTGASDRTGTIIAGGQTHTITQVGITPPGNDFFAQAQVLPGMSGTVSGHNNNATSEAGEPTHAGNPASRSVWYRWTAPDDGLYSFTTSGSDFDTVMAIYTGTSVGGLTRIAENDDTTNFDPTSKINFRATSGVQYSIAVDGKSGVSGSILLGYSRYRRLFRLYLQNFNGYPSPISPTSVTALRQDGTGPTIPGAFVSQGVYEFDLPDDNSPYIVTIAGPNGITWIPSTYLIDNSSARFNELMEGPTGGGQNQTANPTNTVPIRFKGFIHGISTQPGLAALRVQIASTGSMSAIPPRDCVDPVLVGGGPGGAMRVLYDCEIEPNSTHQIVPNASQTAFTVPVLNLPVLDMDTGPASANAMTATSSATYNIGGRVLVGGQGLSGVPIDISSGSMSLRVMSDGAGNYTAANLQPGLVYSVRAAFDGYVFQPQTVNLQPPGVTLDITAQQCAYAFAGNGHFGREGGTGEFSVTATTSQSCGWTAERNDQWFSILSGSGVGNGSVQFSVLPNMGTARQGSISVGGQSFIISQDSACTFMANLAGGSNFPASGGSGVINITALEAGCTLTPTATDYCMINPGGSITGSGQINFTVNANTGVSRSADINLAGQAVNITQDAAPGTHRARFDFDGDGRSDVSVYRPSEGTWYISYPNTAFGRQFGTTEDIPVAADYDGDGTTDLAVFRPSTGFWYVLPSTRPNDYDAYSFGLTGDIPVPADYDGDGKADLAVYRPSTGTWYQNLASGVQATPFGIAEDKPVVGDFDGDGKADIAVYRASEGTWYGIKSSGGLFGFQFGVTTDIPVPADYDGDGKTDLAVYRPSDTFWYRLDSSTGNFVYLQFGSPGDKPVAADYNGDSFADIAVYRPSTGYWYQWSCTGNVAISSTQFGLGTDVPIPYPITP